MNKALDEALAKYKDKEIAWFDGEPDLKNEEIRHTLVVYAFVDDKETSAKLLKLLPHPWLAKDHDRMVFVKKMGKDGELAKKYGITSFPTLVFVAPVLKESQQVVEKKTGEMSLRSFRAIQKRGFELIKKASEK